MIFGKRKKKSELTRIHMVAVRLADAINYAAREIPDYKPILGGFRLTITNEQINPYRGCIFRLRMEPAGWQSGCHIEVLLFQQDGWYVFEQGELVIPSGKFTIAGADTGCWALYEPQPHQLFVNIS